MIEGRVRALVAEVQATADTWTPGERIDAIGELEAAVAMLQAQLNVEVVTYADQRKAADKAVGAGAGSAGRGAPVEIAMACGVSRATVDYQLAFARQLVADHPRLLSACLDGEVAQSAAKHVIVACEQLDPEQRWAVDAELTELACELTRDRFNGPQLARSPRPIPKPLRSEPRPLGRGRQSGRPSTSTGPARFRRCCRPSRRSPAGRPWTTTPAGCEPTESNVPSTI